MLFLHQANHHTIMKFIPLQSFVIIFFLLSSGTIFGQNEQSKRLQIADITSFQIVEQLDKSILQIQQLASAGNDSNFWKLAQTGDQNRINIETTQPNSLDLQQVGDRNSIETSILGRDNIFKFEQYGNDNLLQMHEIQASNTSLEIIQYGNGNELIDKGYNTSTPIRIEQRGGMKIEISTILPTL